jgi:hypothetical protein
MEEDRKSRLPDRLVGGSARGKFKSAARLDDDQSMRSLLLF